MATGTYRLLVTIAIPRSITGKGRKASGASVAAGVSGRTLKLSGDAPFILTVDEKTYAQQNSMSLYDSLQCHMRFAFSLYRFPSRLSSSTEVLLGLPFLADHVRKTRSLSLPASHSLHILLHSQMSQSGHAAFCRRVPAETSLCIVNWAEERASSDTGSEDWNSSDRLEDGTAI